MYPQHLLIIPLSFDSISITNSLPIWVRSKMTVGPLAKGDPFKVNFALTVNAAPSQEAPPSLKIIPAVISA